jgi:hypothetical protein
MKRRGLLILLELGHGGALTGNDRVFRNRELQLRKAGISPSHPWKNLMDDRGEV